MAFEGVEYTESWAVGAVKGLFSHGKGKEDIIGGEDLSAHAPAPHSKTS